MSTCPECRAKFVNRNQWHSCGQATVDDWLEGLGPSGKALYRRLEALIRACGELHVAPAKTRIAFLGQVRFAAITRLSDQEMVVHVRATVRTRLATLRARRGSRPRVVRPHAGRDRPR